MRKLAPVLVFVAGCAPALSSFQPGHVGPKGQLRAEAGMDLALPTGAVDATIDAGKSLAGAARRRGLSEEEKLTLFGAGVNLALNPPALVEHVAVAYNPADRWEVSLRYAGGAWRLGGRHQLLAQEVFGADLSVGVGLSRFTYGFPIDEILDVISIDDFERWTVDVPITFGWRGPYHRLWTGPRVAFTSHSAKLVLRAPPDPTGFVQEDVASTSGRASLWGLSGGAAVGYRHVFLGLELTVARGFGSADLNVFGRTVSADTNSWVISPGFALMGEF